MPSGGKDLATILSEGCAFVLTSLNFKIIFLNVRCG